MAKQIEKPRLLFITQVYPSGLTGTTVKTRRTLEYLVEKGYHVDVCCVHHLKMVKNELKLPNLRVFFVEKNVVSKFSWSYLRRAFGLLLSFRPFRIKKMYDAKLAALIDVLTSSTKYQYIFFDGFSTLQYARIKQKNYVYIDDEDITDLLWKRYKETPNLLLKLFFFIEFWKCRQYEVEVLPKMNQVWAISPNTMQRLKTLSRAKISLMPTIVPQRKNVYRAATSDIVFTALLSWMENIVGLKWFIENCWPIILQELPRTKLIVTGQMADAELIAYLKKQPNVVFKGYVDDLADVYQKVAVAIAPILINSGIKVKILTYLSYGLPVVALEQATWGMSSLGGVVSAKEEEFAMAVVQTLKNMNARKKLSLQAVKNIQRHHSDQALETFFKRTKIFTT